jgi:hypothetical protein
MNLPGAFAGPFLRCVHFRTFAPSGAGGLGDFLGEERRDRFLFGNDLAR